MKFGPLYGDKTLIGILPENQKAYGAKKAPCEYDGQQYWLYNLKGNIY